jgi:hypothetical protein
MIENIDNYLKKNKKQFFAMMNSHWGKNDDDTKKLKFLWNKAQEANGVNDKIAAFEELKGAMKPFIHEDRLAKNEKILEDNNIDKFAVPEDQLTLEMDRMFSTLSNFPEVNKLEDLDINDAYSQNYDYDQMKKLASDYGYDYRNKNDRIEFINKLYEYHKAKNVEDAFKANDLGGVAVDFMLPVSKEYAKKNYENIDGVSDMAGPLVADAVTNAAMMGYGSNLVTKPLAKAVISNASAPVIREGAQMLFNDKPFKDAAIDAGNTVATNIATPYALRGMYRWGNRVIQSEAKLAAKDIMNQTANRVRDIEQKLKDGQVFRRQNYDGRFVYAKKDSKGNIVNISNEEAAKAKDIMPLEDYEFYLNNRNIARHWTKKNTNQFIDEDLMKLGGKEKFESNLQEGKPRFEGLRNYEIADAAGIKPRETLFNWGKNSPGWDRASDYITNFQGQTKYAGPALMALTQMTGPAAEYLKIEKTKNLNEQELKELDMLQRMRELHKNNPKLFSAPKIPEKYKDFFDETKKAEWNSDTNIRTIFGGE